ncbi:unnamed protein product [Toxocara canis]|uniref:Activin_recp domain-containing protein n=1 Tax=Toxocara canis TaxID=6265 RepID=A0A183TW91_TOXCA|nr:unnamed protein product [Toxocara canis]
MIVWRVLNTAIMQLAVVSGLSCYTGQKYIVGQDVRQDSEQCTTVFGLFGHYCYKFVASYSIEEFVKVGCASLICEPIGNTCAEMEFMGARGTLCCCDDNNFCNGAHHYPLSIPFHISALFFIVFLLT